MEKIFCFKINGVKIVKVKKTKIYLNVDNKVCALLLISDEKRLNNINKKKIDSIRTDIELFFFIVNKYTRIIPIHDRANNGSLKCNQDSTIDILPDKYIIVNKINITKLTNLSIKLHPIFNFITSHFSQVNFQRI